MTAVHTVLQSRLICSPEGLHMFPGSPSLLMLHVQQRVPPATTIGMQASAIHTRVQASPSLNLQLTLTSNYFLPAQPLTTPEHTSALHPDCHPSAGQPGSDSLAVPQRRPRPVPGLLCWALSGRRMKCGTPYQLVNVYSVVCHGQPPEPQFSSAGIFGLCLPDSSRTQVCSVSVSAG